MKPSPSPSPSMLIEQEKEEKKKEEHRRVPLKTIHHSNWKQKLRENCFKRVIADRNRLLWKLRSTTTKPQPEQELMDFTFRDIVSDELKKIKDSSVSISVGDEVIWEYDDPQKNSQSPKSECEEITIEMQRIFYEDLREEETRKEQADYGGPWEEEDDYLAEAAFEQLRLNTDKTYKKEVWCPICKRGELREDHCLIYCSRCELQLSRGNEVNLDILRAHLEEAYTDHLDRGCRLAPKFSVETRFDLTALYIQCDTCNTLEIVL